MRFPKPTVFSYILSALLICLAILASGLAFAEEEAEPIDHSGSTVMFPVLGYTPDTGFLFGGTVLRFFYLEPEFADSRPSTISPVFVYTTKKQVMVFLGTGLNWDENRNALDVVPKYLKFPNQFYGVGRDASEDDEENYTSERLGLDVDFTRQVWNNWRLGFSFMAAKNRLEDVDPGGILAGGSIIGTENAWTSALGPALVLDSRDNTWAPDHGMWIQARARFGGSALGSDYTYEEYTLDMRGYWTVKPNTVVAAQILTTQTEGGVPFYLMPRLGGDNGLRGYRGGLYTDNTCALGRVELRRSRLLGRFGVVAFAGIGDVAPSLGKLTLARELWTGGFGFRYILDEKERVNLRIDYGIGNGDSGFFLSLGEAF